MHAQLLGILACRTVSRAGQPRAEGLRLYLAWSGPSLACWRAQVSTAPYSRDAYKGQPSLKAWYHDSLAFVFMGVEYPNILAYMYMYIHGLYDMYITHMVHMYM